MESSSHDFIIAGGGIAGSALASRLHERFPSLSILLIEAGPEASNDPLIIEHKNNPILIGSKFDWNYSTVSQQHLNNRVCPNNAGKALGGGSVINNGGLSVLRVLKSAKPNIRVSKVVGFVVMLMTITPGPMSCRIPNGATRAFFPTFAR